MKGNIFDLKLWIGGEYFGTKPFDNVYSLMATVKNLELLQKEKTPNIEFELYLLTSDPWFNDYEKQNQTDRVSCCLAYGNDGEAYNHFVNHICANVEIKSRKMVIDFLKNHGIKNTELIKR